MPAARVATLFFTVSWRLGNCLRGHEGTSPCQKPLTQVQNLVRARHYTQRQNRGAVATGSNVRKILVRIRHYTQRQNRGAVPTGSNVRKIVSSCLKEGAHPAHIQRTQWPRLDPSPSKDAACYPSSPMAFCRFANNLTLSFCASRWL